VISTEKSIMSDMCGQHKSLCSQLSPYGQHSQDSQHSQHGQLFAKSQQGHVGQHSLKVSEDIIVLGFLSIVEQFSMLIYDIYEVKPNPFLVTIDAFT
jgi:hypothetical protein